MLPRLLIRHCLPEEDPIPNANISLIISDETFNTTTDANGIASVIPIDFGIGKYTVNYDFIDDEGEIISKTFEHKLSTRALFSKYYRKTFVEKYNMDMVSYYLLKSFFLGKYFLIFPDNLIAFCL